MTPQRLKELALAATPGPWRYGEWRHRSDLSKNYGHGNFFPFYEFKQEVIEEGCFDTAEYGTVIELPSKTSIIRSICAGYGGETDLEISKENADYISAANPQVILELLAKLEKAKEALKSMSLPEQTDEKLKKKSEWTSERSNGNYDDVFNDGVDSEAACVALLVREALKQLEDV